MNFVNLLAVSVFFRDAEAWGTLSMPDAGQETTLPKPPTDQETNLPKASGLGEGLEERLKGGHADPPFPTLASGSLGAPPIHFMDTALGWKYSSTANIPKLAVGKADSSDSSDDGIDMSKEIWTDVATGQDYATTATIPQLNVVDSDDGPWTVDSPMPAPSLGARPPQFGAEGQACAGGRWYGECDWWNGWLHCEKRYDSGAVYGTCVRGPKKSGSRGYSCKSRKRGRECDYGYQPEYVNGECYCADLVIVGRRLGAGIEAVQAQIEAASDSDGSDDSWIPAPSPALPKLGALPPLEGGLGMRCRAEHPSCDGMLSCVTKNWGSFETATCEYHDHHPNPKPTPPKKGGLEGEHCNAPGNPWGYPVCFGNLNCEVVTDFINGGQKHVCSSRRTLGKGASTRQFCILYPSLCF